MSSSQSAVSTLKSKMQAVRDEVEKYRDLYEEMCQQHQQEIVQRNQVGRLTFL